MSKIEWTDQTWNPIVGCSKLRAGCKNCYAERMAHRLGGMGQRAYDAATDDDGHWMKTVYLREDQLGKPKSWKKGRRIFVCSMSDLFHEKLAGVARDRIFAAMLAAPQHTYQIVTKRYKEAAEYEEQTRKNGRENIQWMFSASDQGEVGEALKYITYLTPLIKGLCLEPLLGPVQLPCDVGLDWVIVGGESGPGARPMHPGWVRDIQDQCRQYKIPFFFKQWGAWIVASDTNLARCGKQWDSSKQKCLWLDMNSKIEPKSSHGLSDNAYAMIRVGKKKAGRILDGRTWEEYPK